MDLIVGKDYHMPLVILQTQNFELLMIHESQNHISPNDGYWYGGISTKLHYSHYSKLWDDLQLYQNQPSQKRASNSHSNSMSTAAEGFDPQPYTIDIN